MVLEGRKGGKESDEERRRTGRTEERGKLSTKEARASCVNEIHASHGSGMKGLGVAWGSLCPSFSAGHGLVWR
jgi:hypothetical protein